MCGAAAPAGTSQVQGGRRGSSGRGAKLVQMPDDNSCLFHGIKYLLDPASSPAELRQRIAREVRQDPTWDEAMLGKPREEYLDFIVDPRRWGGEVELAIFAAAYRAEIAVLDVQSARCDFYGQGEGYGRRVYLLNSGIHFDAVSFGARREIPQTEYREADAAARGLAEERRASGQFVDQATMRLRCKICGFIAEGDYEARAHAGGTGHKEFAPA